MQAQDWLERWQENQIGFHQQEVNPYLQNYLLNYNLQKGSRIFLPLCGKALDILWLVEQGFEVVGVELSPLAIESFFNEADLSYSQESNDRFVIRQSRGITLLEGDYFDLNADDLGACHLVFDRAALIAIDAESRARYCAQMQSITACPQLLVILQYDQSIMPGPPFSVDDTEVATYYSDGFAISEIEKNEIIDESPRWRQKGLDSLVETVFSLYPENV